MSRVPQSCPARADRPGIHLAVQAVVPLAGDKVQRKRGRLPAAEPLRGFDPSWMRRAVIIGEAGNLVGVDLHPPGGRAQRVVFGIGAELGEQHVFWHSRWDFDPAFLPERIEVRTRLLCARSRKVP
jgi:hypothetical protein